MTTETTLDERVEKWVKENPALLAATAERARKSTEQVIKDATIKPEQLLERVTI